MISPGTLSPDFLPSPEAPSYGPFGVHGLEIGGGQHPRRLKFVQFDMTDWSERNPELGLHYDLGDARRLPYPDEEFEHVFSSNLLEHFPATETTAVLTEWARVLKPDGLLELIVPDALGILRDYFSGRDQWPMCQERLLGSMDYDGNQHFTAFCRAEFPDVIATVPSLALCWVVASHSGGGLHACARKA